MSVDSISKEHLFQLLFGNRKEKQMKITPSIARIYAALQLNCDFYDTTLTVINKLKILLLESHH